MKFYEILKEIDFFGKEPEFYIKRKPKQTTLIGRIFTFIFILIYILFFVYKLIRMFKRVDITFYDTYSNIDPEFSINLLNENFPIFFTLFDDEGLPFIDETIYYPVAIYINEKAEQIKIERCNEDTIHMNYKNPFLQNSQIENYYCLNDVNYIFKPYISGIILRIFPCRNTTENNNNCKSKEFIEEFFNYRNARVYFGDIVINSFDYKNPIQKRINYLDGKIFRTIGLLILSEFQIVQIQTSKNIFGFDFFTNPKIDEFIKFDNVNIIPVPSFDLNDELNYTPLIEYQFQLNDKILTEKRQYTQFIDILCEVGGFMEFINSFFGLICSSFVDILYEKKMVNNLFSFNMKKKIISVKNNFKNSMDKINIDESKKEKNPDNIRKSLYKFKKNKNNVNPSNIIEKTETNINDKKSENYPIKKKIYIKGIELL